MWSDVIMEFKAKPPEGYGVVPSLLLMYLSLGEDYGYNMAKVLKEGISKENGWDEEQIKTFRSITNRPRLQIELNRMRNKNLLLSNEILPKAKETRKYFRLNPAVLRNPGGSKVYHRCPVLKPQFFPVHYRCPKCGTEIPTTFATKDIFEIPEEQINELLVKLHEKVIARSAGKKNNEFYAPYFKKWSKIKHLDFATFINFLKEEALELNMNEFAFMMDQYLQELQQYENFKNFKNQFHIRRNI